MNVSHGSVASIADKNVSNEIEKNDILAEAQQEMDDEKDKLEEIILE